MAGRRRGGPPPKHGAAAARPREGEKQQDDVEQEVGSGDAAPARTFTNNEAQEIAMAGARFARKIDFLIRREERLSKQLKTLRTERLALSKEMNALFLDVASGQGRLPLAKEGDDPGESAGGDEIGKAPGQVEAPAFDLEYEGQKLRVEMRAPGEWTAVLDGADLGVHRSCGEAQEFLLHDAGVSKGRWKRMKWTPSTLAALGGTPVDFVPGYSADVDGKVLRVWPDPDEKGKWRATVGGNYGGIHGSMIKARAWAVEKAVEEGAARPEGVVDWVRELATVTSESFAAEPGGVDPMNVEYGARVGRKACVLRQSAPGKWTGRIGGLPYAVDLPLVQAQAMCEKELAKKGEKVEWIRTETTAGPTGAAAQ